jgi:hypothetical protein
LDEKYCRRRLPRWQLRNRRSAACTGYSWAPMVFGRDGACCCSSCFLLDFLFSPAGCCGRFFPRPTFNQSCPCGWLDLEFAQLLPAFWRRHHGADRAPISPGVWISRARPGRCGSFPAWFGDSLRFPYWCLFCGRPGCWPLTAYSCTAPRSGSTPSAGAYCSWWSRLRGIDPAGLSAIHPDPGHRVLVGSTAAFAPVWVFPRHQSRRDAGGAIWGGRRRPGLLPQPLVHRIAVVGARLPRQLGLGGIVFLRHVRQRLVARATCWANTPRPAAVERRHNRPRRQPAGFGCSPSWPADVAVVGTQSAVPFPRQRLAAGLEQGR